jgi:aspartate racemase
MPTNARVIGLLGGMSWPSTITYYRNINKAVQSRLGGSHSARLLIWSDDYEKVERMQLAGEWEAAGDWLAESACRLQAGGAEVLGIACNTMHKVSDAVRSRVALPLVDMIEVTASAAKEMRCARTAILGTRFTLEMGKYSELLARFDIEPVLPSPEEIRQVDQMIYQELCVGIVKPETRDALRRIVSRLVADGVDSIVLACTELNLLLDEHQIDGANVIDTAQVHINALVDASLNASLNKIELASQAR